MTLKKSWSSLLRHCNLKQSNYFMRKIHTASRFLFSLFILVALSLTTPELKAQSSKPTDSGYATVNGTKIYFEVHGSGKPVILLHGAFYTIGLNWGELLPGLSKTRKVIAIEMQGHGHSPYSERKLDLATFAKDVVGVMNHLKIDSADIIGYSMGGSVAYELVTQFPKKIKSMVIISSTYKTSGWQAEVNSGFDGLKPEIFRNTPIEVAYNAVAPDKNKFTKFIEQMIAFAGVPFNISDDLIAKITAPVLLISGDNDGLDKIELAKTYKLLGGSVMADMSGLPKSQLAIVPAQGHVSLMMQTKTLSDYIEGFLK